jgi:hypothetical protein
VLQVTRNAQALLAQYLEDAETSRDAAIRFVLDREKFALEIDSPHPGDALFRFGGRVVLVLDRVISDSLTNNVLDVRQTAGGPSLELV